jgi:hypothetical protein
MNPTAPLTSQEVVGVIHAPNRARMAAMKNLSLFNRPCCILKGWWVANIIGNLTSALHLIERAPEITIHLRAKN